MGVMEDICVNCNAKLWQNEIARGPGTVAGLLVLQAPACPHCFSSTGTAYREQALSC